jgi:hypothetical protein
MRRVNRLKHDHIYPIPLLAGGVVVSEEHCQGLTVREGDSEPLTSARRNAQSLYKGGWGRAEVNQLFLVPAFWIQPACIRGS